MDDVNFSHVSQGSSGWSKENGGVVPTDHREGVVVRDYDCDLG